MKDSPPFTKIPIDFGDELYEWVRETAHRERRSMADLVRQAVREYRVQVEPQLELPIRRVTE
ncbi:MAG: ribbon-helix-helix protein, CopG family [Chloroflexi bacterium]|nr:ribbon-helix-helix protein, CopG family [Chloroflexota bacterium]